MSKQTWDSDLKALYDNMNPNHRKPENNFGFVNF
jgi:hypothetical protein